MINKIIFILLLVMFLVFGVRLAVAEPTPQELKEQEKHIDFNDIRINELIVRFNALETSNSDLTIRVHSDESYVLGATGLFLFFVGKGIFKKEHLQTLFEGEKK